MADQVPREGAGGGEQVPAATKVAPTVTAEAEAPVPQEQIPAKAESEIKVEPVAEENNKEATLQQPAENTETKPANATTSPVAPGQENEEKKDELTSPAAQNNNQEPPKVEEKPVAAESVAEEKPVAAESVAEEKPVAAESVAEEKPVAVESVAEEKPVAVESVAQSGDANVQSNGVPKESEGWQKRESELLLKIEELEKVKNARSEDGMKLELDLREKEIELLKARVKSLETELQAALARPGGKNHEIVENIKQQHEELLSKARGMIFDKTKMVKNQELQIEALMTQVQSLKDINVITKDLLEIRNSEVKAMDERFLAMEARFKAEKERYDLVLKRAQTSTNINDDLRKEYETQLAIFKELREKYELRVQALVAENNRLKEAAKGPGVGAGPST